MPMTHQTTRRLRGALATAALLAVAGAEASAQLGSFNPLPGPRGTYAIRNARVVTVSGAVIERGTIVIGPDGRITAVGADVTVPAGAQILDGTGLHVYPGMMETGTTMGLSEIPQGAPPTVDVSETGSFNPNARAFFAINPHSAHIGVTRVVGITHVVSRPTGGIISGQASLINLAGDTPPLMGVVPNLAMVINLPRSGFAGRGFGAGGAAQLQGGSQAAAAGRMTALDSLRQMLRDADAYGRAQDAYARDNTLPRPARDIVLASVLPVIRGQMPVIFTADRAQDIRDAVAFAREHGLRPIILGGREALAVAPLLREQNVPVLFTGVMSLPSREDDPFDLNFSMPAKLAAAGVKFALTSGDDGAESRNLPYVAGMAAAHGLSQADALRSVMLWPAEIFGVGNRFGSIEVGKVANLVVTTGDILEARTDTKFLFIDGRPVPLSTRHTYMNDLFRDRP
jgi:imidazolonepropionase-like amidohydrolase